jgi:hypothetical protein
MELTLTVHFDHEESDPATGMDAQVVVEGVELEGFTEHQNAMLWRLMPREMDRALEIRLWQHIRKQIQRQIDDQVMDRKIHFLIEKNRPAFLRHQAD